MPEEIFPILTEDGTMVGKATRSQCHSGSMLIHPVVHLHVTTPDRKYLLLQRRSSSKKIQPDTWDTAVGGHVDYGESIEAALIRESREELAIDASESNFIHRYLFRSPIERELVHVYHKSVPFDSVFHINPEEVSDVKFWSLSEIQNAMGRGILTPNFESEFIQVVMPLIIEAQ